MKTNVNPTLLGVWNPIAASAEVGNGQLANTFSHVFTDPTTGKYGLVLTGWSYTGFDTTLQEVVPVAISILTPDENGLLRISTDSLLQDPLTNGGGSVVVADFNGDGDDDIFLAAHNESPMLPASSTAFLSDGIGGFNKISIDDSVMAHSAVLDTISGSPVIVSATFSGNNPIYRYVGGDFQIAPTTSNAQNQEYPSFVFGSPSKSFVGEAATVGDFGGRNSLQYVSNYQTFGSNWEKTYEGISVLKFSGGNNIDVLHPVQIIDPYLSTLPQYDSYPSMNGTVGITQVFRLWSLDLNKDGFQDILAGQSMWSEGSHEYPAALQVLINKGDGTFRESTESLNPDMTLDSPSFDYNPLFLDIDGSGIETIFSSGVFEQRQSNWVLLNDGTGRLHIGLHDEFDLWKMLVFSSLKNPIPTGNFSGSYQYGGDTAQVPMKFLAVPCEDGSVNFVTQFQATDSTINPPAGQIGYVMTDFNVGWNPATDFKKHVIVSDRNESTVMRTWAGNDTFYDANANSGSTHIDGGLGLNKSIYSGLRSNYNLDLDFFDGSKSVVSITGNDQMEINDLLANIQRLEFVDRKIAIDMGGNAGQVAKLLGAVFGSGAVENAEYVGVGLDLLDAGMSYTDLAALAVSVTGNSSPTDVCNLLWENVIGTPATNTDIAPFKAMLDDGQLSIGQLTTLAADTSFNASNIDLVGLTQTGLEYL
ncbi:hypothetical protein GH816_02040 [Betaproteobacteria bacterium LSUCC0115]|nr:hypothetical protein [Burkholderiales bacterium LSUCC0115]